jgi:hypothetical protein
MSRLIKIFVFTLMLIILVEDISAATVITEPSNLIFENVLQEGYAEKILYIKSDSYTPIHFDISAANLIEKWISFEPESGTVANVPVEVKIKIHPPKNTTLGIYEGYIIISTTSSGSEITTSVVTSTDLKIKISLTESRIEQIVVKDVKIDNIEQDSPINISVVAENQGNVEQSPFFRTEILDESKNNVILSTQPIFDSILPSATKELKSSLLNKLPIGKYWAHTTVFLNNNILRNQISPFNVVEKGTLPKEEAESIKIYPEPVALGVSWAVIIVWALIVAFVIYTIKKRMPHKKKRLHKMK